MPSRLKVERLNDQHDASDFRCGDRALDRYLRRFALPNDHEGYGITFVAVGATKVLGYYTLANSRVDATSVPEEELAELPRDLMPSVLLAKLATHRDLQGRGLGRILLADAYERFLAVGQMSGARLFEVDALDEKAKTFYLRRGFKELLDHPLHLFLTRRDVLRILRPDEA